MDGSPKTIDWKRNLAAIWIAQALTGVGFSFVLSFIPLYVEFLGVRGTAAVTQWAALISAGSAVSMAFAQPIWGNLADRSGRKPMVIRSMLGGGITVGLMGFAASPEQLLVLRFIQGSVTGVTAAGNALVACSTPASQLGFALGLMQVSMFVGSSVGPLVGGMIADTWGFRASFYAGSVLLILGGLIVIRFVHEDFTPPSAAQSRQSFWAGSKSIMAISLLPMLVGVVFLIQLGGNIISPVLSLFVEELNGPENAATAAGSVLAVTGLLSAISAVIIGRLSDRLNRTLVLTVCLLGAAICYVPQAFVQQVWELILLRGLLGIFLGGLMPTANALVAGLVPEERRGAAYAMTATANALAHALGPLTAAAVATQWGIRAVFLATGGFFALNFGWAVYGFHRHPVPALEPRIIRKHGMAEEEANALPGHASASSHSEPGGSD